MNATFKDQLSHQVCKLLGVQVLYLVVLCRQALGREFATLQVLV